MSAWAITLNQRKGTNRRRRGGVGAAAHVILVGTVDHMDGAFGAQIPVPNGLVVGARQYVHLVTREFRDVDRAGTHCEFSNEL